MVKIESMFAAAKETDFPSTPWTGFFQLGGRRIPEELQLDFDGGVVTGKGWDRNGDFLVKGSYDLDSREVRWTKKYADGKKIFYRGFREGRGIWGTWKSDTNAHAGFQIWPV